LLLNGPQLDLKHAELTEKIIGTFYSVYNELYGFLESVYENAMVISLQHTGLKVKIQTPLPVWFRGEKVGDFRPDILVEGTILLKLNCARVFEPAHEA
jgi:GxxExxY protein